ncbi:OTU family ubiquitin thioesterase [Chlamydia gallinacea]|nr:OTU family ubiquitin thioesterase [Chlamydia gallinacea]
MSPIPPACPPPGKNNFYHLRTCPQDSLCIRILRVITYILLHIITLGILLLIHYLEKHIVDDVTYPRFPIASAKTPQIPTPDSPSLLSEPSQLPTPDSFSISPTTPVIITSPQKTKQIEKQKKITETSIKAILPTLPSPSLLDMISFPSGLSTKAGFFTGVLTLDQLPQGVVPFSLEAMLHYRKRGLSPHAARSALDILNIANPAFLATYPISFKESFQQTFINLQQKLLEANPESDEYLVADLQLKQLNYLNNNYYIVEVLGDGNCFYRACFVGWLCYLMRQNHPGVFSEEAERIQSLPFASSSPEHQAISKNMADLLLYCKNLKTLKNLFDLILLSPIHTNTGVKYLRQLATFETDCIRVQSLGEENLKALILGQLEETPELLLAALSELMRIQPSSPLFTEMFLNTRPPSLSATTQALLLLEFLHPLLSSKQETFLSIHPLVREFLETCSSTLSSSGVTNENAEQIISLLPQELLAHYTEFSQAIAQCVPPIPKNVEMFSFLLSRPSCTNHNTSCNTFYTLAYSALQTQLENQSNLSNYLNLSSEQTSPLYCVLEKLWSQKLFINTVDLLLSLPGGMQGTLVAPQLEHAFTLILRLLFKAPKTLSDSEIQEMNQSLLQCIQQSTHLTTAFASFLKLPLFTELQARVPDLGQAQARAIQLFLFAFQYPRLVQCAHNMQATNTINKLMLLFYPYLQQAVRKQSNFKKLQTFSEQIWGFFCCHSPKFNVNINPQIIESTVLSLSKHPQLLFLCDPEFQLAILNILKSSSDPRAARELIHEIKTKEHALWTSYIKHVDTASRKLSQQNKSRLTTLLPQEALLFSFLNYHPQVCNTSSSLGQQCHTYLAQQTSKLCQELVTHHSTWASAVEKNRPCLSVYKQLQEAFLLPVLRPTQNFPETRQTLLQQLSQLSTSELQNIFNVINFQAEDEHVSALSTTLGSIGLCQYLADSSLSQTPAQLIPLADSQGFLKLDFSPEDQAHIHIFRGHNHYNCLLRKDPDDTSRNENSKPLKKPQP